VNANVRLLTVLYRIYCSSGNTVGLDEYVSYSEIGGDGYWERYLEIKSGGMALRYDRSYSADTFGVLPEGKWDEKEAAKPMYGVVAAISRELFEAVWTSTRCANERPGV
jgi:hypothetical protein